MREAFWTPPTARLVCCKNSRYYGLIKRRGKQIQRSFKLNALDFSQGTTAGFIGEPEDCPMVVLREGMGKPHWAICDMYYDLYCEARIGGAVRPDEKPSYRYEVRHLGTVEAGRLVASSRNRQEGMARS